MIDIIKSTLELLNNNSEWQQRYDGYLDDICNNYNKIKKGFHKPKGLSVYTTVGDRNKNIYYLRFKGQNVGKVTVCDNGNVLLKSMVNESKSHGIIGCPLRYDEKEVDWHSRKAKDFRTFFIEKLPKDTRTKSPEHEVENAILEEFRKRRGDDKALRNIQPVLLHGNFFQMPTPLKASTQEPSYAGHSGGGIDMLARIKTKKGHSRLCVIEIKDENKPAESQKDAMSQAIIYATFIAKLLSEQPRWMNFFMGHKSDSDRNSRCLDNNDIEVLTIMPEGETDVFQNKTIEIPGTRYKLHCHSLYYNNQKFRDTNNFEFTGTFLKEIRE